MAASITSAAVRFQDALARLAATAVVITLLLPARVLAAAPYARTYALTPLEQERIVTPRLEPGETREPVFGYLRRTDEGWKLDMLPGAVTRTGPLPALTNGVDAAREDATNH